MSTSRKKNKRIHKRSRRARKYKARGGNLNNKRHYNIYNSFHYGDHIFNLKFFFGIVDILKEHNIVIHYYYDPVYIINIDELTRYINPKVVVLDTLDKKPADAFNMWMNSKNDYLKIESAISTMYKDTLKYLGLDNLQIDTSIYQKEDYLLDIYKKLDDKFKNIKVLILNAEPKSGQFSYNKEKMDNMCRRLAGKFKVVVISPVDNIPCSLTDGLKLQDIGAISTGAEYIIGFNSGPLIPCFNIHTKNKVKKWIIFDSLNTVINEVNVIFFSKQENIDTANAQINNMKGGSKKPKVLVYTHLGVGDMFLINGAVNYLATLYDQVHVVCRKKLKNIIEDMYSNNPSIKLLLVDGEQDMAPWSSKAQSYINDGFDIKSGGEFAINFRKDIYDYPNCYYDAMGIDRAVRKSYFHVPRTEQSKKLFEAFKGRPYIVVHQEFSNGRIPIVDKLINAGETRLIINLNNNEIDINKDSEGHAIAESYINRKLFSDYVDFI